MTLRINPDADGDVTVPFENWAVTVDALRDIPHDLLASAVSLGLDDFEDHVRKWAEGPGLEYGILVPKDPRAPVCPHCGDIAPYGDARHMWISAHLESRLHRWWWNLKRR